jgi:threonylcarbamoyladenosine tRNA methylthiotransferase MtaB
LVPAEFFVHNIGCKLNRVESDELSAALLAAGALRSARDEAQLVIVNTCAVTGEAEAKTRKAIRQALASPLEPWVIATGCAVTLNQEAYRTLDARVIIEPDQQKAQETALKLLGLKGSPNACLTATIRAGEGFNTRMGIKIQDGCGGVCSYCVVRVARGASRSMPLEKIQQQACSAEDAGVREIVLTGVNIGCYDDNGTELGHLLHSLLDVTTEARFRLSSLEPLQVTDELLSLMAASQGRICAHLHLPLQSGCDRTLEAMRRPYDTAFFAERVARARALMPGLALTTDVIVGFPTENDEDFSQSAEFCKRMRFSRMHVFRYSPRPGTPAAEMKAQSTPVQQAERACTLRALAQQMLREDLASRVGSREMVLIERQGRGTSESYHQVEIPPGIETGQLLAMQFTGYRDTLMQGIESS